MTSTDRFAASLEANRKTYEQIETDRVNLTHRNKWREIRPNTGPGFLSHEEAKAYGTCLRMLDAARRQGAASVRITVQKGVIQFEHELPADPSGVANAANRTKGIGASANVTECKTIDITSLYGEDTASTIDAALTASRYMPLAITLNGTPIEREDFLRGADRIETVKNYLMGVVRIGVWLPLSTSRPGKVYSKAARISVSGVPWIMNAPRIKTFDGELHFGAETEATKTGLMPAFADPEQAKLIRKSMRTIGYRLLAHGSVHDREANGTPAALTATRTQAARYGIPIPEPIVRLRKWDGQPERTQAGVSQPYAMKATTGPDTVIVNLRDAAGNDPAEKPTVARAMLERTMVEAFAGQVDARCAEPKLSGIEAYERLPMIREARVVCRDHPSTSNPNPKPVDASIWASTRIGSAGRDRPYRLEIELEMEETGNPDPQNPEGLQCRSLPVPFALFAPVPGGEPGRDCILLSTEPWPDRHDPEYIADAMLNTLYRIEGSQDEPVAERDARRRKMLDAAVAATCTSDRDRQETMIKRLAVPEIINHAPRGTTTTVKVVLGPHGTVESMNVKFEENLSS